jgi:hypothetical protein
LFYNTCNLSSGEEIFVSLSLPLVVKNRIPKAAFPFFSESSINSTEKRRQREGKDRELKTGPHAKKAHACATDH